MSRRQIFLNESYLKCMRKEQITLFTVNQISLDNKQKKEIFYSNTTINKILYKSPTNITIRQLYENPFNTTINQVSYKIPPSNATNQTTRQNPSDIAINKISYKNPSISPFPIFLPSLILLQFSPNLCVNSKGSSSNCRISRV